eukprot:356271-Chlamydomonas_euryale.AAC.2
MQSGNGSGREVVNPPSSIHHAFGFMRMSHGLASDKSRTWTLLPPRLTHTYARAMRAPRTCTARSATAASLAATWCWTWTRPDVDAAAGSKAWRARRTRRCQRSRPARRCRRRPAPRRRRRALPLLRCRRRCRRRCRHRCRRRCRRQTGYARCVGLRQARGVEERARCGDMDEGMRSWGRALGAHACPLVCASKCTCRAEACMKLDEVWRHSGGRGGCAAGRALVHAR